MDIGLRLRNTAGFFNSLLGPRLLEFSGVRAHVGVGADEPFNSDIGALLPIMWPDFVVVSTPILHFLPGVVKAQEPVRVQAFVSELAIEGFDEAVVRGLARPGEVENDTALIGPQIEIARDELGARSTRMLLG
jgi:hypothetical protein